MPLIETQFLTNQVQIVTKTITFDGSLGKGKFVGDGTDSVALVALPSGGAFGYRLGILVFRLDVIVVSSLVGAAGTTLSISAAGEVAPYDFDAATNISTLTTGKVWTAGAATTGAVAMGAASKEIVLASRDPYIFAVPGVHDITGGSIRLDCYYLPLGIGAVPAT